MERLYLIESARTAWAHYLARDTSSGWSSDARERMQALVQVSDTTSWNLVTLEAASAERVRDWVEHSPQAARDTFFASVMSEWGRAVLRGDRKKALAMIAAATRIARAFEALGGDQSVSHALS